MTSACARSTVDTSVACTTTLLSAPYPVRARCTVVIGATTVSPASWKPLEPFCASTPTTVSRRLPTEICWPTGFAVPKRLSAVVGPITATLRAASTSDCVK